MTDYPYNLDVRPLTTWPGALTPAHQRERSLFSATMRQTLSLLTRELDQLGARHPVLEVAIEPGQFRLDGRPRATAKAEHPGVVLSLPHTSVGALRYATDRYLTWQDNLRAIALGLEALRKVDRYGITRRGEQYAGFKALPPGSAIAVPTATMTVDEAARLLVSLTRTSKGEDLHCAEDLIELAHDRAVAFRTAARMHHPDVGGDRVTWDQLEQAKRVLDEHGSAS